MAENRSEMRLFDRGGNRLYLDAEEGQAFLAVAREQEGVFGTTPQLRPIPWESEPRDDQCHAWRPQRRRCLTGFSVPLLPKPRVRPLEGRK